MSDVRLFAVFIFLFLILAGGFAFAILEFSKLEKKHQMVCKNITLYYEMCNITHADFPVEIVPFNISISP